uniref:WhiB family transcriptional regulator n=1 Tax=Paenibacillus chitinolyticus TaxID=79263 RepID=UPI00366BF487
MIRHTPRSIAAPDIPTADDWRKHAACSDDPDAMFPGSKPQDIDAAKAICAGCTVRPTCLHDAMEAEGNYGADR